MTMTRMVLRSDLTPKELLEVAVAVREAARHWTSDTDADMKRAVLALFRPAEEPECSHEWIRTMEGTPEWCRKCLVPKDDPAPVAPPPAEEPADRVAALDELAKELASMPDDTDLTDYWERWSKALTALRSELAAARREIERLRGAVRWAIEARSEG